MSNGGQCNSVSIQHPMLTAIKGIFLVFSPTQLTNLDDPFSFYSRTLRSNHNGDVYVSEESIEHLGTVCFLSQPPLDRCSYPKADNIVLLPESHSSAIPKLLSLIYTSEIHLHG